MKPRKALPNRAKRHPSVMPSPAADVVEGGIRLSVSFEIPGAEVAKWDPGRIALFFGGIRSVVIARNAPDLVAQCERLLGHYEALIVKTDKQLAQAVALRKQELAERADKDELADVG